METKINQEQISKATQNERKKRLNNILPFLNKDIKILDGACGDGWLTEELIDRGYNVVGIDINLPNENIDFIKSDLRKIPFPDKFFDCIISFHTLEHVKCENEFKRVLKDGGILIVEVPKSDFPFHILNFFGLIKKLENHIRVVDFKELPFNRLYKKSTGFGLCKFGVFTNY